MLTLAIYRLEVDDEKHDDESLQKLMELIEDDMRELAERRGVLIHKQIR